MIGSQPPGNESLRSSRRNTLQEALAQALTQLASLPPLVTSWEIEALKKQLRRPNGRSVLLQGGDCAENFSDCSSQIITNKLKILLQMSLLLIHGLNRRVIRSGTHRRPIRQTQIRRQRTQNGNSTQLPR